MSLGILFWTGAAATDRELGLWLLGLLALSVVLGLALGWAAAQIMNWVIRRRYERTELMLPTHEPPSRDVICLTCHSKDEYPIGRSPCTNECGTIIIVKESGRIEYEESHALWVDESPGPDRGPVGRRLGRRGRRAGT